jgi:hypothetical protein
MCVFASCCVTGSWYIVAIYTTLPDNKTEQDDSAILFYCGYTIPLHVSILIDHHQVDSKWIITESLNCKLMLKWISIKWIHFSHQDMCYNLVLKCYNTLKLRTRLCVVHVSNICVLWWVLCVVLKCYNTLKLRTRLCVVHVSNICVLWWVLCVVWCMCVFLIWNFL